MDAVSDADTPPPAELAQWRRDVRLRALARRAPAAVRAPLRVWVALACALLLLALARRLLTPAPPPPTETVSLQIVLRDAPAAAPEPPLSVPPPARALPPLPVSLPVAATRAASNPAEATENAPPPDTPASPPHVFNLDGSIDLPRETAPRADALVANFSAPPRSAEALRIMTHQRPLKVRPNHFAANFRAPSGSTLTDFVEDHLTASKSFTLPWGTHVDCKGIGLGVAWLGACGWYTPYKYYVPQAPWRPASVLDEQ